MSRALRLHEGAERKLQTLVALVPRRSRRLAQRAKDRVTEDAAYLSAKASQESNASVTVRPSE
jgi:hypothetical protein